MSKSRLKIIGLIEGKVRNVLNNKTIIFRELFENTGIFNIVNGAGIKIIYDNEISHKLGALPIVVNNLINQYWLSINISCNTSSKSIKGITISIYSDYNNDGELKKLFRAEWTDNGIDQKHAQPHWHIHYSKSNPIQEIWDDVEVKEFSDYNQSQGILIVENLDKIHFAMSALWHKKMGHALIVSESQDSEIVNWVEGVIKYVIIQLGYIHNKSYSY